VNGKEKYLENKYKSNMQIIFITKYSSGQIVGQFHAHKCASGEKADQEEGEPHAEQHDPIVFADQRGIRLVQQHNAHA
jgi:hypothetical protein